MLESRPVFTLRTTTSLTNLVSFPMKTSEVDFDPSFSVVVPCFNEEENIVTLVDEILTTLGETSITLNDFEVIVVDDCSTDGTVTKVVNTYAAQDVSVRVVRHMKNCGQSAAVYTGVEAARYPWIVTLDGDGQNDPADIPNLISRLHELTTKKNPMICGYRKNRKDTGLKKFSSRVANGVRSRVLGDATPDTGCGLKLFNRQAFLGFPQFNHMHRFLPALARREGGYVESVVVNHRPRKHGISKYGVNNRLWVGLVDMVGVMWLKRRQFRNRASEEVR